MRANEQKLDTRRYGRTSGREVTKSISIKIRKRRSSGSASKVNVLTPGDLHPRRGQPRLDWAARLVDPDAEVRKGRSVRWAAHESGGLKSLRRPDEGRRIQRAGVMPRWPVTKGTGGQGVRSDPESEGLEEKYRAVINGGYPEDEQVGQRWGKVEPALWGQRRSHSPIVPRCLLTARYGRFMSDPRRPARVPAMSRVSDPISQKRNGKRCSGRSRRTE
jgi:hypothetical protein